jgi:CBS domain-containing protein
MPGAALDPVAYLRATPPFHALPQPLFDRAASALEVGFYPAGARLVRVGGEPLHHLYVIRKGAVRLERHGQVLQVLEEGETFGYTSLITGRATLDVIVDEDLVAYRLPAAEFDALLADAQFAGHFAVGLAERLKSSLEHSAVATFQSDLSLPVGRLVRRPPLWIGADATIGDAARLMSAERVSSLLVRGDPPGIVTDHDFRDRVLAAGRGPETPVAAVLSRPLRTAPEGAPLHEAWAVLIDAGVHHLPLVRGDEIMGVVTAGEVLRQSAQGPVAVLRGVERLASRESLPGYARKVTEMAAALLAGGLDAAAIAGFVARLNDALVARILRFAEADLGEPPAPYAWLALGSEGRMEQTLLTDQDNALVFGDDGAARRPYFEVLAERVNEDLELAGFPRCPGGFMARRWLGTLSEWRARFEGWLDRPAPQALLEAAIFLDWRRVAGRLDVSPLQAVLAGAADRPVFLRFLARAALGFKVPASLRLRLRGEASTLDLKQQGLAPVVFLARCYGLEVRPQARSTLERLAAAREAGALSAETEAAVAEAFRFLVGLRLRLQLQAVSEGRPPGDAVAMSSLPGIERSRLKESLRAVRGLQERAQLHFKADF